MEVLPPNGVRLSCGRPPRQLPLERPPPGSLKRLLGGSAVRAPALPEEQVANALLPIPVDQRDRGDIERGVREHEQPDLPPSREDGPKHQSGYRCLLHARPPLVGVVRKRKERCRKQDSGRLSHTTTTEQLAQALEEEAAKQRLFPKACPDQYGVEYSWECRGIARDVVVAPIDRIGTQKRHDGGLHHELKRNAKDHSNDHCRGPALWNREAQGAPRSLRRLRPQEHENGTEREHQKVACGDDGDRQQPDWAKAAQPRREQIRFLRRWAGGDGRGLGVAHTVRDAA